MPLTIELYDDSKKEYGFLIIDRDNLIFQFLPNSASQVDMFSAMQRRNSFEFLSHLSPEMVALVVDEDIDDPRHLISDHICESDKGPYHTHLKFSRNIDLDMMLQMIDDYPVYKWLETISPQCYAGLRDIVRGYFQELTAVTTLSPSPAQIESEYQAEKNAKFEQKTDQLKLRKPPQLPVSSESKQPAGNGIGSGLSLQVMVVNGQLYMLMVLGPQLSLTSAMGAADFNRSPQASLHTPTIEVVDDLRDDSSAEDSPSSRSDSESRSSLSSDSEQQSPTHAMRNFTGRGPDLFSRVVRQNPTLAQPLLEQANRQPEEKHEKIRCCVLL